MKYVVKFIPNDLGASLTEFVVSDKVEVLKLIEKNSGYFFSLGLLTSDGRIIPFSLYSFFLEFRNFIRFENNGNPL